MSAEGAETSEQELATASHLAWAPLRRRRHLSVACQDVAGAPSNAYGRPQPFGPGGVDTLPTVTRTRGRCPQVERDRAAPAGEPWDAESLQLEGRGVGKSARSRRGVDLPARPVTASGSPSSRSGAIRHREACPPPGSVSAAPSRQRHGERLPSDSESTSRNGHLATSSALVERCWPMGSRLPLWREPSRCSG
jgi:hypothetical protein